MISINSSLYRLIINLRILHSPRHKHVRGNVIGAPHKYWDAIQFQIKRAPEAVQVGFLDPINRADPVSQGFFVQDLIVQGVFAVEVELDNEDAEGIERLCA
jgi:hypothetical protein